jgi:hypothetical protein
MGTASENKDGVHPILVAGSPEGSFFNKTHIPGVRNVRDTFSLFSFKGRETVPCTQPERRGEAGACPSSRLGRTGRFYRFRLVRYALAERPVLLGQPDCLSPSAKVLVTLLDDLAVGAVR